MPPRVKGGKKGRVAALPPGSELETLAWGHHIQQTAKWRGVAEEIRDFTNTASLGLLTGTGRAEWALYAPTLGVGVPITRAQAIEVTPADMLRSYFDDAEADRKRGPRREYNPEDVNHITKALKNMTKGSSGRYGEGAAIVGGRGLAITKAQGLRARLGREGDVPTPPAPPAPRAPPAQLKDVPGPGPSLSDTELDAIIGSIMGPPAQVKDMPTPVAPGLADTDVDPILGGIRGPPEAPLADTVGPIVDSSVKTMVDSIVDNNTVRPIVDSSVKTMVDSIIDNIVGPPEAPPAPKKDPAPPAPNKDPAPPAPKKPAKAAKAAKGGRRR